MPDELLPIDFHTPNRDQNPKTDVVRFRVTPEEHKIIQLAADRYADGSLSNLIRHLLEGAGFLIW